VPSRRSLTSHFHVIVSDTTLRGTAEAEIMRPQRRDMAPLMPALPGDADWRRSAVVYQVYPRSFSDHDGDGTGDILGIIDRLPYLAQLGIDAIWVSPWYPSPMADGGYDVNDYRDIHPD
jgi:1,4-alpha-glucan branching enzyme